MKERRVEHIIQGRLWAARHAPARAKRAVRALRRLTRPAWLGTIRRTTPLSAVYGFDRGTPVAFLHAVSHQ